MNTPQPAVSKAKVEAINVCVEILTENVRDRSRKEESGPHCVGRNRKGKAETQTSKMGRKLRRKRKAGPLGLSL